jgi:hypothetical protein
MVLKHILLPPRLVAMGAGRIADSRQEHHDCSTGQRISDEFLTYLAYWMPVKLWLHFHYIGVL